jgi:hypothetical protein
MTDDPLGRRITFTGWSTVLLGVVCLGLAGLELLIPVLLKRLADSGALETDPSFDRLRATFAAGAALSASVNAGFGIALAVVGAGVTRRARWSHPALTIVSWASIPALLLLARPGLAPLLALSDATADSSRALAAVSAVLLVLQVAAVLWFLRFWNRPEVRARFR